MQHRGQAVRYIEVEAADIALANRLAHEVLGRTLDELPPQTRRLLETLHGWTDQERVRLALRRADFRFSRRQVRELIGWGDTQLKVHLARLAELEYLLVHRTKAGQGYEYELLYDGEGAAGDRFLMGLATPDSAYDAKRSAPKVVRSAHGRGVDGVRSPLGRSPKTATIPLAAKDIREDEAEPAAEPIIRLNDAAASYRRPVAARA